MTDLAFGSRPLRGDRHGFWRLQYDAASRKTLRIDGRGLRTSYSYDAASRLTGQQYQDGTRVTNTYDANSQRTVLSDLTGSYTSTYDPDGRVSSVINPAGIAITYGYDAASQRASMNQPTGLFTYTHDAAGRITKLVNPEGQVTSWVYDKASRVLAMEMANGTLTSNTYDNANQVLLLANLTTSGTTLSSFNYTYNPVGNRTQVVEANGDVLTLSYDPTYQLTNEKRSGANSYNISYTYDPVGNRTVLTNSGALTTNTYNAGNELVTSQASAGVTTSTYDGDGNLLTSLAPGSQSTTNTWDGENRLTRTALPSGIVDSFTYNGDGLRVQKQDSAGTTNHVWDGQNILLETNASNIIQVVYTLEPAVYGNLISQSRSGVDSFLLFDALGSTRKLTNSAGTVTDDYLYDSFGNIIAGGSSGTTTNPFRYVGRLGYYLDRDLQSYYIRARVYNPGNGRFLSRDPEGGNLLTLNLYLYAQNESTRLVDPSGRQDQWYDPPRTPPVFPPRGGQSGPAKNCTTWFGANCCLFTPKTKASRRKPFPGPNNPPKRVPRGPDGGWNTWYGTPVSPVGAGGCAGCVAAIIKCAGGVAVFHFTAGDDPSCSLHPLVGRGLGHRLDWVGCTAIICGGDDSQGSNCLADSVVTALYGQGIDLEGVADNSACGVNPDGSWYSTLY